jgi:enamine deaminase RidA (YjgF/YER057c/UK114 family)
MENLGDIYYADEKMAWGKGRIARNLVFLSGVEGIDPVTGIASPNIRTQTKITLDKVKLRLEEAGTDFDHIVKFVTYVVGRENLLDYREARTSWMNENKISSFQPASTLLIVAGLAQPEMFIEIDVIAELPE